MKAGLQADQSFTDTSNPYLSFVPRNLNSDFDDYIARQFSQDTAVPTTTNPSLDASEEGASSYSVSTPLSDAAFGMTFSELYSRELKPAPKKRFSLFATVGANVELSSKVNGAAAFSMDAVTVLASSLLGMRSFDVRDADTEEFGMSFTDVNFSHDDDTFRFQNPVIAPIDPVLYRNAMSNSFVVKGAPTDDLSQSKSFHSAGRRHTLSSVMTSSFFTDLSTVESPQVMDPLDIWMDLQTRIQTVTRRNSATMGDIYDNMNDIFSPALPEDEINIANLNRNLSSDFNRPPRRNSVGAIMQSNPMFRPDRAGAGTGTGTVTGTVTGTGSDSDTGISFHRRSSRRASYISSHPDLSSSSSSSSSDSSVSDNDIISPIGSGTGTNHDLNELDDSAEGFGLVLGPAHTSRSHRDGASEFESRSRSDILGYVSSLGTSEGDTPLLAVSQGHSNSHSHNQSQDGAAVNSFFRSPDSSTNRTRNSNPKLPANSNLTSPLTRSHPSQSQSRRSRSANNYTDSLFHSNSYTDSLTPTQSPQGSPNLLSPREQKDPQAARSHSSKSGSSTSSEGGLEEVFGVDSDDSFENLILLNTIEPSSPNARKSLSHSSLAAGGDAGVTSSHTIRQIDEYFMLNTSLNTTGSLDNENLSMSFTLSNNEDISLDEIRSQSFFLSTNRNLNPRTLPGATLALTSTSTPSGSSQFDPLTPAKRHFAPIMSLSPAPLGSALVGSSMNTAAASPNQSKSLASESAIFIPTTPTPTTSHGRGHGRSNDRDDNESSNMSCSESESESQSGYAGDSQSSSQMNNFSSLSIEFKSARHTFSPNKYDDGADDVVL